MDRKKIRNQVVALVAIGLLFVAAFWLAYNKPGLESKYQVDKFIHFLAGGFVAMIIFQYLPNSKWQVIILAIVVGFLWEIFEYYGTVIWGFPIADFNQRHYLLDTILDEIAVGLGAFVFSLGLKV